MTTKPKPVTLFGRRMRATQDPQIVFECRIYRLAGAVVESYGGYEGEGHSWQAKLEEFETPFFDTPQQAARALERKIVAQWKRLGKLIGGSR
jgi:hypothetical protein